MPLLISSQLDVDKLDYLLRDSHYAGVKYGVYDLDRLVDSLSIRKGRLVVLEEGILAAHQLVLARYYMFEQVYLHKTKRAFEGMLGILVEHLKEQKKFDYPSPTDLTSPSRRDDFRSCDDDWLISKIFGIGKPLNEVAELIRKRIPYKVIYDSQVIARRLRKIGKGVTDRDGSAFLEGIEIDIKSTLPNLKIKPFETLFDEYTDFPYRLRPYSQALPHEPKEEPATILIHDRDNDFTESLEERIPAVKTMAESPSRIKRMYVKEEKKSDVINFLRKKYSEYFV